MSSLRGRRLLLAGDNEINRAVALAMLRRTGLTVDVALDGREAIAMATRTTCDLILMDVQMPLADGLQATRALRQLPGRRQVPILAMTAHAFDEDRQACLAARMNDHVAKPADVDQLYAALVRWMPSVPPPDAGPAAT